MQIKSTRRTKRGKPRASLGEVLCPQCGGLKIVHRKELGKMWLNCGHQRFLDIKATRPDESQPRKPKKLKPEAKAKPESEIDSLFSTEDRLSSMIGFTAQQDEETKET